jgi:F-type H+-transporting ATPase subunit epsilon
MAAVMGAKSIHHSPFTIHPVDMADPMKFDLVSPERQLLSARVLQVVIPGTEGHMTVMANHAPVMTALKAGLVKVRLENGQDEGYVVFGGFADITPDGCTLLAEEAVRVADIDVEDLNRRISEAREDLADAADDAARADAAEQLEHLETLRSAIG